MNLVVMIFVEDDSGTVLGAAPLTEFYASMVRRLVPEVTEAPGLAYALLTGETLSSLPVAELELAPAPAPLSADAPIAAAPGEPAAAGSPEAPAASAALPPSLDPQGGAADVVPGGLAVGTVVTLVVPGSPMNRCHVRIREVLQPGIYGANYLDGPEAGGACSVLPSQIAPVG